MQKMASSDVIWRELFARVLSCACVVASCQSMSKQTNIKLKKIPIRESMIV